MPAMPVRVLVLCAVGGFLLGCSGDLTSDRDEWARPSEQTATAGSQVGHPSLLALTEEFPSFGGLYFDASSAALHVQVVDGDRRTAEAIVARLSDYRDEVFAGEWNVLVVERVRFSYGELAVWGSELSAELPWVAVLGIEMRHNSVAVGVRTEDEVNMVQERASELEIPADAVRIVSGVDIRQQ